MCGRRSIGPGGWVRDGEGLTVGEEGERTFMRSSTRARETGGTDMVAVGRWDGGEVRVWLRRARR